MAALSKVVKECHYTPVKVENGADRYCMKEDTRVDGPFEFGDKPVRRNVKADWEEVKKSAIDGKFDQIPAELQIKHLPNLLKLNALYSEPKDFAECRGIWIWGPSGTGKTTFARTHYSADVYIKA